MTSRLRPQFLDCSGMTLEEAESFGHGLAEQQRDCLWQIGDLVRHFEATNPDVFHQIFPEWTSPDLISRCKAVAQAYPTEDDRNTLATWTTHMRHANRPDRVKLVQAHVDAGHTSDEARKADASERQEKERTRWLLAVDANYYLHKNWFSGAGVEAASRVAAWVERTTARLKDKGLTDVLCCFDSKNNFRKELTEEWEDKYKPRPPKEPELIQQLVLVRELLDRQGCACVSVDGFEADDVMASAAAKFPGRVTLLTQDKDLRQCLTETCNMLLGVEWSEDETTGELTPEYEWVSAKTHMDDTGIRPSEWAEYQAICGDNVDGIKGVCGIGVKGAKDLISEFGTVGATIQAAKDEDERIKPKQREALIAFEPKADITLQLVTLRTDLQVRVHTRL